MKNCLKLLFISVLISVFTVSCMQAKEPEPRGKNIAWDFKLQDLSGKTFSLSDYRDKQAVVLFFWATWCPFCRKELGALNGMYQQLAREGIELLAIDVDEPAAKVENAVKNNGLSFKVLLDKGGVVATAYAIYGVPTYIIVDKKGAIVFRDYYFPKEKYRQLVKQ